MPAAAGRAVFGRVGFPGGAAGGGGWGSRLCVLYGCSAATLRRRWLRLWNAAGGSHTKISYLCIHVCIQQHVLWLQVPVHHHVPVAVIHSREDLLEKAPSFCLLDLREERREQRWGLGCTQSCQGKVWLSKEPKRLPECMEENPSMPETRGSK